MAPDHGFTAFCGVDCAACGDMLSGKCPGCRQSIGPEGDRCGAVECCIKRGIDICSDCSEFVCRDMAEFFSESEGHRCAYRRLMGIRYGVNIEAE